MSLDDFDPMTIDISEFKKLSEELPKDSSLSLEVAEYLAVVYLRAADRCSEIHSALIWYTQKAKLDKNTTRQKLFLLAKDEGHKTMDDKRAYAESHPDYVEASERLVKAETVKRWFEDKHSWFLKSHQYMKDRMKAESSLQNSSGFSEVSAVDKDGKFGEKPW
jgi:hypothetical protein